ncbi:MAG: tRNA (adenosine(37)-N6)-dimethylallyltransferase MiaA [Gemmatimonadetes bacterium]|jgi:tRNA dimethylallyltransferase|nr:tRNA (adenosine(37)-N6)-dimethylallyltransferase MiaA [Gemmatimonadota bacterium]MBT5141962.1 tRNA (adenosine(37)-N6)-dimethylallyltransferase MiaA [Gemmatimonadota bacterium]MBT5589748.1 tRNA (adenosine(37)-N6)-dimethylallyltransferase MiaA [Gemmatimonadota bacterium]MBT5964075.1 tRNA (adenosine(37)-N6)-dimethylallyltransferase MiaA [Gemmatimonadota bacterium]MBT6625640.1 tRNA (adenosine(37)-N6)-dimethylallyltransferase MiaA [Gemmatimonadota bacterium]
MPTPLVVIAGPTGVGKTQTAIRVAQCLGAQILSADSRQIYRHLDIGTAKPTADQRRVVAHHLLDLIGPQERFSAGEYGRQARQIIDGLRPQGTPVVLVGGSGMYVDATVDGFGVSPEADSKLRSRLESRWLAEGPQALHEELAGREPETASRLHVSDRSRILRALELLEQTGHGVAPPAGQRPIRPVPLLIALHRPREQLYQRIGRRIEDMMHQGWLAEVEDLLKKGISASSPGMESLGYAELTSYLGGKGTLECAVEQIGRKTRRYAKRQMTWLRRDRRYRWLDLARFGQGGTVERIVHQWQWRVDAVRVDSCT